MTSIRASVSSLMRMFEDKAQEFNNEVDNVHMVWLEEIQQEANRMFSRDFNAEPELMPKTPSQKKNTRRKRVSSGRQDESQTRRRFSKGRRSNLRGTAVKSLNLIDEEENTSDASTSTAGSTTRSKRPTRKKKQTQSDAAAEEVSQLSDISRSEEEQNKKPELVIEEALVIEEEPMDSEVTPADTHSPVQPPPELQVPDSVVSVCSADRLPAEPPNKPEPSPGRSAAKIAIAGTPRRSSSRRSSKRCSLKLRHSMAGLRHSMVQESVRRSSHRSMLKRKAALKESSTCSNSHDENTSSESAEEDQEDVPESVVEAAPAETQMKPPEISLIQSDRMTDGRVTRSMAVNSPALAPSPFFAKPRNCLDEDVATDTEEQSVRKSSRSIKRKTPETVEDSPSKRQTPPKKSQTMTKPHMKSFLHTVHKNQMLMMTPGSLSRTAVIKSFIKSNTPLKPDHKAKERQKLEALKKKQEQEEERMKKMEEEKRKKQEELKRKRDERLRRVIEAKVKEEQKEEEKKKRIEQKMAQIDEKNDKRLAEEKAKKKVALKRQEELELKKKLEEEAKKKKLQQAEEEKRQQELLAQKKAEEEELRARKLAEARRALELEQEREREQAAAAERARVEKEKLLALQREVERAAREKELREQEKKRKALEDQRKLEEQQRLAANEKALREREAARQKEAAAKQISACLNTTVDVERSVHGTPVAKAPLMNVTMNVEEPASPQSYFLSPKGGNKPTTGTLENYGMDQNSDDSTDDESAPKKVIPSWAQGLNLQQAIMKQYFNPPDLDSFFGAIKAVKLEEIFDKKKPRYFKRTSSAVWHSPLGAK